jgi:hypothetical protein
MLLTVLSLQGEHGAFERTGMVIGTQVSADVERPQATTIYLEPL